MRMRPSAVPCQRLISRAVRSIRPFVGAGTMSSTVRRRSRGNRSSSPGTVSMEDDVGDRRRQDDADPDVAVRAGHRLERLVGDGGQGEEEIVSGRAAGLEHLDRADGRRQVLVLRRAERVVAGAVGQQILERPVPGTAAREVSSAAWVCALARPGSTMWWPASMTRAPSGAVSAGPTAGDAVTVDEDVGARERRRAAAQDPATANEECHGCLCISRDPARVKARGHAAKSHTSRPGDDIDQPRGPARLSASRICPRVARPRRFSSSSRRTRISAVVNASPRAE